MTDRSTLVGGTTLIAFKTLSNLTHHLQPVPVDEPMAAHLWKAPETPRGAAAALQDRDYSDVTSVGDRALARLDVAGVG